jgi:hypothetical protein
LTPIILRVQACPILLGGITLARQSCGNMHESREVQDG